MAFSENVLLVRLTWSEKPKFWSVTFAKILISLVYSIIWFDFRVDLITVLFLLISDGLSFFGHSFENRIAYSVLPLMCRRYLHSIFWKIIKHCILKNDTYHWIKYTVFNSVSRLLHFMNLIYVHNLCAKKNDVNLIWLNTFNYL